LADGTCFGNIGNEDVGIIVEEVDCIRRFVAEEIMETRKVFFCSGFTVERAIWF
jgi:hypothetical protein